MAVRIELWMHGYLVDGTEAWWDDMELLLSERKEEDFPLLSVVDPYGEVILEHRHLRQLMDECQKIVTSTSSGQVRGLLVKLMELCALGAKTPHIELRFIGD